MGGFLRLRPEKPQKRYNIQWVQPSPTAKVAALKNFLKFFKFLISGPLTGSFRWAVEQVPAYPGEELFARIREDVILSSVSERDVVEVFFV